MENNPDFKQIANPSSHMFGTVASFARLFGLVAASSNNNVSICYTSKNLVALNPNSSFETACESFLNKWVVFPLCRRKGFCLMKPDRNCSSPSHLEGTTFC